MKTGPNERCPCGSGKKYKRCCQPKDLVAARSTEVAQALSAPEALPKLGWAAACAGASQAATSSRASVSLLAWSWGRLGEGSLRAASWTACIWGRQACRGSAPAALEDRSPCNCF